MLTIGSSSVTITPGSGFNNLFPNSEIQLETGAMVDQIDINIETNGSSVFDFSQFVLDLAGPSGTLGSPVLDPFGGVSELSLSDFDLGSAGSQVAITQFNGPDTALANLITFDITNASVTFPNTPPPNTAPTAEAGGPYVFSAASQFLNFDGSASTDDSAIATFEWDVAGGVQGLSGPAPSLGVVGSGLTTTTDTTTVTLTVTDDDPAAPLSDTDTADISYANAAPVIASATGVSNIALETVEFEAVFDDADLALNAFISDFETLQFEFDTAAASLASDIGDGFLTGSGEVAAGSVDLDDLAALLGGFGTFDLFFNVVDNAGVVTSFQFSATVVPEPGALTLVAVGLLPLVGRRCRNQVF